MNREEKCEMRDRLHGQVRMLEYFYKNCQTWEVTGIGSWLVSGIMLSVATPIVWAPYQKLSADEAILCVSVAFYLLWIGIYMYMRTYTCIVENRRQSSMRAKLQYHPVDRRSIRFFYAKRLLHLLLPLGLVWLIGQFAAAYLICGQIGLCNVLYPMAEIFFPGGLGWICACAAGRTKIH